jgi:predicted dehydrogenase
MKTFKWGIIGPGRIAQKFADCVKGLPDAEVYAVASRSSLDLEALANRFAAKVAFNNYEALVQDPAVDAVYIATPHRFHKENALLCLTHAKPVMVEKAFAVNTREAESMTAAAKENNVFLMEAMWTRFLPIHRQVQRWIDDEKIGEVKYVALSLGFIARRDLEDRLLNPALAGGCVLDLGVYAVAVAQAIFKDSPKAISAQGFIGETGVDEAINVGLDQGDGKFSQFFCSFLVKPSNRLEIFGTKGKITIHPLFNSSNTAILTVNEKDKQVYLPHQINGFEYQIEEAQRCIRAGKLESPLMPWKDSLENMRVMDEIRRQIGVSYSFEKE